jgi:hypothetical protein
MSGYLQRMVSSARNPARSIHPTLGSLFSAPIYGAPLETVQPEENLILSNRPEPTMKPAAEPVPILTPRRVSTPETPRRDADTKPLSEERILEPLVVPRPEATEEPAAAFFTTKLAASQTREPDETSSNLAPELEGVPRYSYRPLIEEDYRPAVAAKIFSDSAPRAFGATGAPQRDVPNRIPQPERERDEIEIHIGRIEVTAVPQVAARPAAPPARKSLNLDEYLKRRDRRA